MVFQFCHTNNVARNEGEIIAKLWVQQVLEGVFDFFFK